MTDIVAPVNSDTETPKVYVRRWLMLGLFCLYSFSNSYQWIHMSIIANVISRFYNESLPADEFQRNTAVDWLSMVYMLAYIPLIFPATWFLDKRGLRTVCVLGSLGNAVGAWLKCASVSGDRFALLMVAQTVCSIAQIFVLGIPTRLSAVWFGPNEVATATSIGVFGNQMGAAVGFLLPPILVPIHDDIEHLTQDLSLMFYINAGFATLIFALILCFFRDKPPQPPSRAQQLAVEAAMNENYIGSMKKFFKNVGFVELVISYGIQTGCYYAIATLLNPIILYYFPGEEENTGRIGLTIIVAGLLGAIIAGVWLDKTKAFKMTTIGIYVLSLASMLGFTFTLSLGRIWLIYLTAGLCGFFMTGYLPVGFEFAAEITYPESEGTSSGLLNASAQLCGVILTVGMRAMLDHFTPLAANLGVSGCLVVGIVITGFIKPNYARQNAGDSVKVQVYTQETHVNEFVKQNGVSTNVNH